MFIFVSVHNCFPNKNCKRTEYVKFGSGFNATVRRGIILLRLTSNFRKCFFYLIINICVVSECRIYLGRLRLYYFPLVCEFAPSHRKNTEKTCENDSLFSPR